MEATVADFQGESDITTEDGIILAYRYSYTEFNHFDHKVYDIFDREGFEKRVKDQGQELGLRATIKPVDAFENSLLSLCIEGVGSAVGKQLFAIEFYCPIKDKYFLEDFHILQFYPLEIKDLNGKYPPEIETAK